MNLTSVLLVVFIVLKLIGILAWSWWVLSPIWITFLVVFVIHLIAQYQK